MVLQNGLIAYTQGKLTEDTPTATIGTIDEVDAFSESLDVEEVTGLTVEVDTSIDNEITHKINVPTTVANGTTINAINIILGTTSFDISKHTDVEKTEQIIIQYEQPSSILIN